MPKEPSILPIRLFITIVMIDKLPIWTSAGTPMPIIDDAEESLSRAPLKLCEVKRVKKIADITKLANCDATVAAADPATPQPRAKMKTASSTMLRVIGIIHCRVE